MRNRCEGKRSLHTFVDRARDQDMSKRKLVPLADDNTPCGSDVMNTESV